ncbi:MAG: hypothetical protein ACK5FX_06485 [Flavobacteriia bacterium]
MNFIEREHIDIEKWDRLVSTTKGSSVFSMSFYLDAVAENWCILVNEDYTRGMAIPYVVRLKMRCCYTPIFVRYLEWCGPSMDDHRFMVMLKAQFRQGQLNTKQKVRAKKLKRKVFQVIPPISESDANSQTKRMLNKFGKSSLELTWGDDLSMIMHHIRRELPQKVHSLNKASLDRLGVLVSVLQEKKMLQMLTVREKGRGVGGIFVVEFNGSLLYLKGAMNKDTKDMGGMYAAMQEAIDLSQIKQLLFDFGGSNAEGVKRFNTNLGGQDSKYYAISWDNLPTWFQIVMKIRGLWKKG